MESEYEPGFVCTRKLFEARRIASACRCPLCEQRSSPGEQQGSLSKQVEEDEGIHQVQLIEHSKGKVGG